MSILVIIPARKGSKGIPRKNVNLLCGKPLISYALENALTLDDAEVVVSTDDIRVREIAEVFGVRTVPRSEHTAGDAATLDEVVAEALSLADPEGKHELVLTLQPTSPLLRASSLQAARAHFLQVRPDTLVSAEARATLTWSRDGAGYRPNYRARLNRQFLEPIFEENGALVFCNAALIRETGSRFGRSVQIFELDQDESVDIDTINDWAYAEALLRRKRIALVCEGHHQIGMGHVFRALTLASRLCAHHVTFFCPEHARLGIGKIRDLHYDLETFHDLETLPKTLAEQGFQLVINDFLETPVSYMAALREAGLFVVNFEDTGPGTRLANLVFNALYEWSAQNKHSYYGYRYECLRDDIYLYPVKTEVPAEVGEILVSFGGTDVNDATRKMIAVLDRLALPATTRIKLILGIGYQHREALLAQLAELSIRERVTVLDDVPTMAGHLSAADLVISGNGRMVYEVTALGTPMAVFSQNERECHHGFAQICPGICYLGSIFNFDEEKALRELRLLVQDRARRIEMNRELQAYGRTLRGGLDRVIRIMFDEMEERA